MPGFLASLFVDPDAGDGVVALANATTGLDTGALPLTMLSGELDEPVPGEPWVPTDKVPDQVGELLGLWFWGNTATELRWSCGRLELRALGQPDAVERFEVRGSRIVGTEGYHRGEQLHVVRNDDGTVNHLDVATFIHTRIPYDPAAPIPGGTAET
jgi:hypothetical protein